MVPSRNQSEGAPGDRRLWGGRLLGADGSGGLLQACGFPGSLDGALTDTFAALSWALAGSLASSRGFLSAGPSDNAVPSEAIAQVAISCLLAAFHYLQRQRQRQRPDETRQDKNMQGKTRQEKPGQTNRQIEIVIVDERTTHIHMHTGIHSCVRTCSVTISACVFHFYFCH